MRKETIMLMPYPITRANNSRSGGPTASNLRTGFNSAMENEPKTNLDSLPWFCSAFNKGMCTQKAPHPSVGLLRGKVRTLQHICAICWSKTRTKQFHAEIDPECPLGDPNHP